MKKMNKLFKIILVLCLTVTQFTPLISVSADETINNSTIDIIEDLDNNKNYVVYKSQNTFEEGSYYFKVSGSYTYLDNDKETIEETFDLNKIVLEDYKLEIPKYTFDGTYELTIALYKKNVEGEDTKIDTKEYNEKIEYPSGLKITPSNNVENGVLAIDTLDKNVVMTVNVLPGKLAPTYKYSVPYEGEGCGEVFSAQELLAHNFAGTTEMDYASYLYSTYGYNYKLYLKNDNTSDILALEENFNLEYGEMQDNDEYLTKNNGLNISFSDGKAILPAYNKNTEEEKKLTIQNILDDLTTYVYPNREYTYKVFDIEGSEVDNLDYAKLIENGMSLEIAYKGVVLNYAFNFENDYNKDSYFDELDLLPAVESFLNGKEEVKTDTQNITEIVNKLNGEWNNPNVQPNPIVELNGADAVNVGDEIELTYEVTNLEENLVNTFGGILNYDSTKLELVSITCNDNWVGSINLTNNKVLFASVVGSSNGIILKFNFKALTEGDANVSLSNVSLAINNKISGESASYDLSKDIKIMSIEGVGGESTIIPTALEMTNVDNKAETEVELKAVEEKKEEVKELTEKKDNKKEIKDEEDSSSNSNSKAGRVVIVILIVLVIGGLVYLIFKDDEEEEEDNKNIVKSKK